MQNDIPLLHVPAHDFAAYRRSMQSSVWIVADLPVQIACFHVYMGQSFCLSGEENLVQCGLEL
jgi:hypothetical protein